MTSAVEHFLVDRIDALNVEQAESYFLVLTRNQFRFFSRVCERFSWFHYRDHLLSDSIEYYICFFLLWSCDFFGKTCDRWSGIAASHSLLCGNMNDSRCSWELANGGLLLRLMLNQARVNPCYAATASLHFVAAAVDSVNESRPLFKANNQRNVPI